MITTRLVASEEGAHYKLKLIEGKIEVSRWGESWTKDSRCVILSFDTDSGTTDTEIKDCELLIVGKLMFDFLDETSKLPWFESYDYFDAKEVGDE